MPSSQRSVEWFRFGSQILCENSFKGIWVLQRGALREGIPKWNLGTRKKET